MLRSVPLQFTSVVKIAPVSWAVNAVDVIIAPTSTMLVKMKARRNLVFRLALKRLIFIVGIPFTGRGPGWQTQIRRGDRWGLGNGGTGIRILAGPVGVLSDFQFQKTARQKP